MKETDNQKSGSQIPDIHESEKQKPGNQNPDIQNPDQQKPGMQKPDTKQPDISQRIETMQGEWQADERQAEGRSPGGFGIRRGWVAFAVIGLVCFAAALVGLLWLAPQAMRADEEQQARETGFLKPGFLKSDGVDAVEEEKLHLSLEMEMDLYKGETAWIGFEKPEDGQRIAFSTSDARIAQVERSGAIRAKHCGEATVTARMETGTGVRLLRLDISVIKSSYAKRMAKKNARAGSAKLWTNGTLYKGEKIRIHAASETDGAEVSCRSTRPAVAVLRGDTLKAKKGGKTRVVAVAKSGSRQLSITAKIRVKKPASMKVTNADKDKWFKGSAMIGNSVGMGVERYCRGQYDGFLGNAAHWEVGCYGVYNDCRAVSGSSLHPVYQGEKRRIKDICAMCGYKNVFVNYGMNDLNMYRGTTFVDAYSDWVREFRKTNPDTTVYVVSITPIRGGKGNLQNNTIDACNEGMKAFAKKTKGVEYIDVSAEMKDAGGQLSSSYSSDGFCHLSNGGAAVYCDGLKRYAAGRVQVDTDAKDAAKTEKEAGKYGSGAVPQTVEVEFLP